MAVNLISCENFVSTLQAAIADASDAERAALCEALNCGTDLAEIVSAITPNMITVAQDGKLIVKPSDMVSDDANNVIVIGTDGKLYVDKEALAVKTADLISKDVGNIIVEGADGGLYARADDVDPRDLISGERDNALTLATDGGLFVDRVIPEELISGDAGNIIKEGSDKLLYASVKASDFVGDLVSPDSGNQITIRNEKLYVQETEVRPSDMISNNAGNIISLGTDSKLLAKVNVSDLVSSDTGNDLVIKGGGLYVEAKGGIENVADIVSDQEGNIITATKDNKLYAAVDAGTLISSDVGNIIKQGADGKLSATANSLVSNIANNLLQVDARNQLQVASTDLLSSDANNSLSLGTDSRLYYNRGITWTTEDPGAGSPLPEGHIVLVYEEVVTWDVVYAAGGDDVTGLLSSTTVVDGQTYTIPAGAPTRSGFSFSGYSDGTTIHQPDAALTVTSDITLTAQWTANS